MALPKPQDVGGSSDLRRFLKVKDIGKPGTKATIVLTGKENRVLEGNFGEQLVCSVTFKGKDYDWGITLSSVNYKLLYKRFGSAQKNWKGAVKVKVAPPRAKGMNPAIYIDE